MGDPQILYGVAAAVVLGLAAWALLVLVRVKTTWATPPQVLPSPPSPPAETPIKPD